MTTVVASPKAYVEPLPPEGAPSGPARAATAAKASQSGRHWLLLCAAFVVVCAGIRAAEAILAPAVLGGYVATVNMPLVTWLRRRGLPMPPTVALVLTGDTVLLSGFLGLLFAASTNLTRAMPRYSELLLGWETGAAELLGSYDLPDRIEDLLHPSDALRFVASLAGDVAGGVWDVVVALIIAAFLLFRFGARSNAPATGLLGTPRARRALREVNRYVAVKTATSMATGLMVGAFLWLAGAELPMVLGILAFLLNYVPNLGSFAAALPGVAVALLVGGAQHAAVVAAGYLAINVLVGNILEPRVMGRALGLWPVVVLLSVMFWGFLLGIIGALLSALLTALMKMALLASDDLRPVGLLLGPGAAPTTGPGLVASDLLEETLPQTQPGS